MLVAAEKGLARSKALAAKSYQTEQKVDELQAKVDQLKASIAAKSFRSFGPKRAAKGGRRKSQQLQRVKASRVRSTRLRIHAVKHSAALARS